MLDDDHRVAFVHKPLQDADQHFDIFEVQAGGGFVEQVKRIAGILAGQLGGEFQTLALAAAEGRGGLTEREVAQAHLLQRAEFLGDGRNRLEKVGGLGDAHIQYLADILPFVFDGQGVGLVTAAAAFLAGHLGRGQEMHLDQLQAGALAGLAAAALHIEGEAVGLEAPDFGIRRLLEELADVGHHVGIGGRIAAWRAPDGALVDLDDLVDVPDPVDAVVGQDRILRAVELVADDGHQRLVDEGTLAAAAHAADAHQQAEGQVERHVFQVVAPGALEGDIFPVAGTPLRRNFDPLAAEQVIDGRALPGRDRRDVGG